MRETHRLASVALLVLVAFAAVAAGVGASPPPVPASYYGDLTVNGDPAPAGVTVTARIDGEVRGTLVTDREGRYGGADAFAPKLQVDGTAADEGATVTFYVEGVEAGTTTWRSGDVRRVDLSATGVDLDGPGDDGDDSTPTPTETPTETPPPTSTPTSTPTQTPTPTPTPTPTSTPTPTPTDTPTPTPTATPTPTPTPTSTPAPTSTPTSAPTPTDGQTGDGEDEPSDPVDETTPTPVPLPPDPDESGAGTSATVSVEIDDSGVARARVENASAGDPVRIDFEAGESQGDGSDDEVPTLDALTVTARTGTDFNVGVTRSRVAPSGTPSLAASANGTTLGYFNVTHSIADANVSGVSFEFRVGKARLAAAGRSPEDVALARYANGRWTDLPTVVVAETATHYRFDADSPGLSVFAVRAVDRPPRAVPRVTAATVERQTVRVDESVTVLATVSNPTTETATVTVTLSVDGTVVDADVVTVAPESTTELTFARTFADAGTYELAVDGASAGRVVVEAAPTPTPTPTVSPSPSPPSPSPSPPPSDRPLDGVRAPGFGIGAALVALVVAGGALLSGRR